VNTIWAGSDDGKINITRDGGKSWTNITPKELPKNSVVAIIDESRHKAGTAYVAAFRYQVDDRQPYVFRTTDFGRTWTKIVTGIKDGHFSRSVREDHVRPGLLFLGTEHGAYVSFNAGDNWQPLQLNLPDTPIRDLVVKNDDVVLGTHGRGFWILDDINPLRQLTPELMKQNVILFQPSDAIRGVYDAAFQYYLKDKVDTVKIEILDANGNLVRKFIGTKSEEKPIAGDFWGGGDSKPTAAAGLNTFRWNGRYEGATIFDGIIIWGARPQNGPEAPIGKYQVRFKAGSYSQTYSFNVKMNPNVKGVSESDLKETFDLAIKIRDRESAANEAVIRIRDLKKQIEERAKEVNDPAFSSSAKELIAKITAIEEDLYQTKNRSGQDPLNFPIKLGNRLSALRRSLETGDGKPTAGAYKVFEELNKELDSHLGKLETTLKTGIDAINPVLMNKQMKAIIDNKK
jgi:photosystem II stability/assembly factor-like uncharacterized protein/flagellar hook assembly protein FlgD